MPLAAREISVSEAVALAMEHNRGIAAADAQVAAANAGTEIAAAMRMPRLDLRTGVRRSDAPLEAFGSLLQQQRVTAADFAPSRLNSPGFVTNYQTEAMLALPLYHGGALTAAHGRSEAEANRAEANREATKQQTIAAVIHAFIAVQSNTAEIKARQQAVATARRRLHDIKQLRQQGMALESDVMDAESHLLRSQLALTHSRHQRDNSLDDLHRLTGNPAVTVHGTIDLRPIRGSLEEWIARGLAQRHDLKALKASRRAMTEQRAITRAAFLPNIDLVASQQWNSGTIGLRNRNSAIGATVSVNLFNGGSDHARITEVEARIAALDARIAALRDRITTRIRADWRLWQEAKLRLTTAEQQRKQRREALRIRTLRHQQGLEKSSELLRSQTASDQAEVAAIRARYGVIAATTQLYLHTGTLTPEVIKP